MNVHEQFEQLARVRWWGDTAGIAMAQQFLDLASQPENMNALLDAVPRDPVLSSLSERLRSLDKIVLLNDHVTKTRLRLHHFKEGSYDLMHNHRWPFYSKILKGRLVQEVFESIEASAPQFVSTFHSGLGYFLGPHLYHKLRAQRATVTLVLRGIDLLPSSQWRDVNSGEVWGHVGGKADTKKIDFDVDSLKEAISTVRASLADE